MSQKQCSLLETDGAWSTSPINGSIYFYGYLSHMLLGCSFWSPGPIYIRLAVLTSLAHVFT